LKLGIIGNGNFSEKVRNLVSNQTEFNITGIYDGSAIDEIPVYSSLVDLIHQTDAVMILDFMAADFGLYSELIKNGKHLYIESPALFNRSELRKLDMLAQEASSHVQIGLKQRFYNIYDDLEKYELFPRIIDFNRQVKFDKKSTQLSVIDDLMMHDIDVTLKIANGDIKSINSTAVGIYYKDPDVVNTRIEFYNGCIATLSSSKIGDADKHRAKFFQNTSFCSIDFHEQELRVQRNEGEKQDENQPKESWGVKTTYRQSKDSDGYLTILSKELISFYNSIANNQEPEAGISEYLQLKSVSDKIKEQLERNFITNE
jgi:predicted dehydrogenase